MDSGASIGAVEGINILKIYDNFDGDHSKGQVLYGDWLESENLLQPATPQNLRALSDNLPITLNWSPVSETSLNKYNIYRSTSSNTVVLIDSIINPTINDTSYIDGLLYKGITYYYRITTVNFAEIESAFVAHPKVAEAAVVGFPHDIKGNGLYCFVTLNSGIRGSGDLERDLKLWVRKQIGPIATPDVIQFAPGLPKTRSGKIMRRILRKIAEGDLNNLGDISTLADPSVVENIILNKK